MKKEIASLFLVILTLSVLLSTEYFNSTPDTDLVLCTEESIELSQDIALDFTLDNGTSLSACSENSQIFTPNLGKSFVGFKEALGFKESQNNYFRVNKFGYLGRYQFGRSTLNVIGIYDTKHFLNTPQLQEEAFIANTKRNKWVLRREIKRFEGKYINGIKVTESGVLAAAHLAGPGSVKKYLRSYGNIGFSDAFGTSIKSYMKKFSGYDTSSIKPEKKVKVKFRA